MHLQIEFQAGTAKCWPLIVVPLSLHCNLQIISCTCESEPLLICTIPFLFHQKMDPEPMNLSSSIQQYPEVKSDMQLIQHPEHTF